MAKRVRTRKVVDEIDQVRCKSGSYGVIFEEEYVDDARGGGVFIHLALCQQDNGRVLGIAVILAATNQVSALKQTVSTLIEKFGSGITGKETREHLEMLRSKYPEAMHGIELPAKSGFQ